MASKNDIFGRIIGFIVFAFGIAILGMVATTAYRFFTAPAKNLMFSSSHDLGKSILLLVIKLLMLLLITGIGSLIAGKGVQFYYAASQPMEGHKDTNSLKRVLKDSKPSESHKPKIKAIEAEEESK